MKMTGLLKFALLFTPVIVLFGCSEPEAPPEPQPEINPSDTIGMIANYYMPSPLFVQGIGIVAGLAGTGSSECPPDIRAELEKYIRKQITKAGAINPRMLIDSQNTAIVEVSGFIQPLSRTTDRFDVILRPLSSTQTTSLDSGVLYTAELKELSRLTSVEQFTLYSKTLATAKGPVYTKRNAQTGKQSWYVLGGGKAKEDSSPRLILNNPSFVAASAVRNRINERFGPNTAKALSTAEITLTIPLQYRHQRQHFLDIVKTLILGSSPEVQSEYVQKQIQKLLNKEDIEVTENTIEGIGKPALDSLGPLLGHPDPDVQFSAAQCMLRIGDDRAISLLRSIIMNPDSPYRHDAIRVVGGSAKRRDALSILKIPLSDSDISVRLLAYEMLDVLNSPDISRKSIADGSFVVDKVLCTGPKAIYAYRQGRPRIVLFGSPVDCNNNIFVQSEDLSVTINAQPTDTYVSVSRKHPQRPRVIGPLPSGFEVSSLVQTLGEHTQVKSNTALRPGLAVPYSEILLILEKMCKENAISAQFHAEPEPELEPVLQNLSGNRR